MSVRWLRDARIPERMHAQGLPLDMMLSVDRGSDAVVLRVTTRHLTREEARELGSRLIEAGLLAGEREGVEPEPAPHNEHGWARGPDESDLSGGETDMPERKIVRVVDRYGAHFTLVGDAFRLVIGDGIGNDHYTMDEIVQSCGIREVHFSDGSVQQL